MLSHHSGWLRVPALSLLSTILVLQCAWAAPSEPLPTAPTSKDRDLSFPTFVRRIAALHPRLQAARLRWQGAQAYTRGIGHQPNPYLRLGDTLGTPIEEVNSLNQTLEISGQPGLRRSIASRDSGIKREELRQEGRLLTRQLGTAYFEYWGSLARLRVARERVGLLNELLRFAGRRLEVGEISRNQFLRVEVEATRASADLALAEGQERINREALVSYLHWTPGSPLPLAESPASEALPEPPATEWDLGTLEESLARQSSNPDLQMNQLASERAELQGQLSGKEMAPKLQFTAYRSRLYQRDDTINGIQLSIAIPLFDYGQVDAEVQRWKFEKAALEVQSQALAVNWQQQLRQAREKLNSQRLRKQLLGKQALGLLELVRMSQKGYDAGLLTILEVFDTQKAYREVLTDYIDSQVQLRQAEIELYTLMNDPLVVEEDVNP